MANYNSDNIFWKIINGQIPCDEVYQDDYLLAFRDINPAANIHILVIPKEQFTSFDDFTQREKPEKLANFFKTVQKIASQLGVDKTGYRLITNHGKDGNQTVPHFHVHILAGEQLKGF